MKSNPQNHRPWFAQLFLIGAVLAVGGLSASAQIINIDFLAFRGTETEPGNVAYPSGFIGGGTVYNGLVADNSATTDNIFVSGTDLVDSFNNPTSIGFSTGPIGADNGGIGVFNGSYLFTNSANNSELSAPFTINGLGTAPSVDLIFFTTSTSGINVPSLTFDGGLIAATPTSVSNMYTYEFDNVAVIGGTVTGTVGTPDAAVPLIFSGLAISVNEAPEPSTYAMMVAGLVLLGFCLRRKSGSGKA